MAISGIGVQQILPQTGIGGQKPDAKQEPDDDFDSNPAMQPGKAPPAPGTGQIVDRIV